MTEDVLKILLDELTDKFGVKASIKKIIILNTSCPYCDKSLSATFDEEDAPVNASPTICSNCFNIMHFDEKLQLIKYTPESWQALGEGYQRVLRKKQKEIAKEHG